MYPIKTGEKVSVFEEDKPCKVLGHRLLYDIEFPDGTSCEVDAGGVELWATRRRKDK